MRLARAPTGSGCFVADAYMSTVRGERAREGVESEKGEREQMEEKATHLIPRSSRPSKR